MLLQANSQKFWVTPSTSVCVCMCVCVCVCVCVYVCVCVCQYNVDQVFQWGYMRINKYEDQTQTWNHIFAKYNFPLFLCNTCISRAKHT